MVNFSGVVEKLAMEEEPFPARAQLMMTQNANMHATGEQSKGAHHSRTLSHTNFDDRSKSLQIDTKHQPPARSSVMNTIAQPTLSASIKTKYIVRSRHNELTTNRFLPVNGSQARSQVRTETIHDAGEPKRTDLELMQKSTYVMQSIHGHSVFRNTSPVTQDQL